MTTVDTVTASKHWKDERDYLKKIGFVGLSEDEKSIELSADEEGNYASAILTPKAARWLARMLIGLADEIEKR